MTPAAGADHTRDTFFHGRVVIFQERKGYRFSVDAPLLAHFLPRCSGPVLEVGCGSGVVSLLALSLGRFGKVTALEIQPGLAALAERNARENGLQDKLRVVGGDFRERRTDYLGTELVFSNPPFLEPHRGRLSADPQVRQAKFEVTLGPVELVRLSSAILAPNGALCLIVPQRREKDVAAAAAAAGLAPARRRLVHPFAGQPPNRLLLDLRRAPVSRIDLPPLALFREPGVYTPEMEAIFAGSAPSDPPRSG